MKDHWIVRLNRELDAGLHRERLRLWAIRYATTRLAWTSVYVSLAMYSINTH